MNKEAEVGLIVPRITQHFLAIFEYIPFAVRIPFAVPPPVVHDQISLKTAFSPLFGPYIYAKDPTR